MSFGDCSFIGGHIGKTWKKVMKMRKHTKRIPSGTNTGGKDPIKQILLGQN